MGKKRIEKIQRIDNDNQRKVTFCKRKKGLLKKSIEFAQLCDVSVFLYVYDKDQRRVVHFASNPQDNLLSLFNEQNFREFFSSRDYIKVGGREGDLDITNMADSDCPQVPDTEVTGNVTDLGTPQRPVEENIEIINELI